MYWPNCRGSMRDLMTRALQQRSERHRLGGPPLPLHTCLDIERFVYESECRDGLQPLSCVHYALKQGRFDESHPKHPNWRGLRE